MKSTIAVYLSTTLIMLLALNTAEAQRRGAGGRGNRAEVAGQPANPNNAQVQNRAMNGMLGRFGDSARLAQMMIAQFDKDGDAALNAAELQLAMTAFMQQMQAQMQQHHGMQQGMGQNMNPGQGQLMGRGAQGEQGGQPGHGQGNAGGGSRRR